MTASFVNTRGDLIDVTELLTTWLYRPEARAAQWGLTGGTLWERVSETGTPFVQPTPNDEQCREVFDDSQCVLSEYDNHEQHVNHYADRWEGYERHEDPDLWRKDRAEDD